MVACSALAVLGLPRGFPPKSIADSRGGGDDDVVALSGMVGYGGSFSADRCMLYIQYTRH